jgi:hypothetical protein
MVALVIELVKHSVSKAVEIRSLRDPVKVASREV